MEMDYLKYDSILTVQPIELKLATNYIDFSVMYCVDFGTFIYGL